MTTRTYGWVQNPSDFNKLKKTVQVFDSSSNHYQNLKNYLLEESIIHFPEIKESLKNKFDNHIAFFDYIELVGTSKDKNGNPPKSRKDAQANSILQISLLPQNHRTSGKRFTDNWTSDGFLRWGVSLGFIQVDRETDIYRITELGLKLSHTEDESEEEIDILREAFLSYPPATRVLSILNNSSRPLNKFSIGNFLGFRGEKGFTSYNNEVMTDWFLSSTGKEARKIKNDIEGTSDKYARMICNWLMKVGYVTRHKIEIDGRSSFPAFSITGRGKHSLNQSLGSSKNKKQEKFIMWEFLATSGSGKNYIRTRRAYIIKHLVKSTSYQSLIQYLQELGFDDDEAIIDNDINGLINFGLRIVRRNNKIILKDVINDFTIPNINVTRAIEDKHMEENKAKLLKRTDLNIKYIELLDIAYDKNRNLDFEIITTELLKEIYGLKAIHLGGGRKPDGIAFTKNFGILFDTKAYGKGYGKNIQQSDAMIRYIEDNKRRDSQRNSTTWWEEFDPSIPESNYYFLWISSKFLGQFEEQIQYTSNETGYLGGGINVTQLLIGADLVLKEEVDVKELPYYFKNEEIQFREEEYYFKI